MAAITAAFPKFSLIKQLGIFSWNPGQDSNSRLKPFCDVTAQDVLTRIQSTSGRATGAGGADDLADNLQRMALSAGVPQVLLSSLRLPVSFISGLPPQNLPNHFPNDPGYIVPLYVALQRGVSLNDIDFVLGGSALDVLANRSFDPDGGCRYLVQRAAGVIVVAKNKPYVQNYADTGFQFERLLTGGRLDGRHGLMHHESMHLMQIGDFRVLFAADADAVDAPGHVVEIKSGNPRYFGSKVMFQMVSSGAQTLIHAEKRGSVLTGVVQRSLADMMQEHAVSDRNRWQESIVAALDQIKKAVSVSENFPHAISFAGPTMSLLPQPAADSILPRSPVVSQLLASWLAPATAAAASVGPKKQQQPTCAGGSGGEAALGDNAGARGGEGRGRGRGRGGRGGSGQEAAAAVAAATAVDATVSDAGGSGGEAALGDNAGARGGGGRGRGRGRGGRGGADAP